MKQMRDRVAGLDVHRDNVVACTRIQEAGGAEPSVSKEKFPTTGRGIQQLASFLSEAAVTRVAMESTGVYWKPVVRHEALSDRGRVKGPPLRDCRSSLLKLGAA